MPSLLTNNLLLDTRDMIIDRIDLLSENAKLLDTAAILDTTGNKESVNINYNENRILTAVFLLCTKRENLNKLGDPILTEQVFEQMVNQVFQKSFEINTDFKFYYCQNAPVPDVAKFEDLEGFENKRNIYKLRNNELYELTKKNKKKLDRGYKVINIIPYPNKNKFKDQISFNEHLESLHSNAEHGGILANLYQQHITSFDNEMSVTTRDYANILFDITLIHEMLHLFGLSDRYQFLLKYKLNQLGDCIESVTKDLIPFAVDPKVDFEALNSTQILNNIMYGVDDFCRSLTTYQKKVILDFEKEEEQYKKVSVLVNSNDRIETLSSNKGGLVKFKSLLRRDVSSMKNEPIIGLSNNGIPFSFINIDYENTVIKVNLEQNLLLNGKKIETEINKKIGFLVLSNDAKQTVMPNSTNLAVNLLALKNCDKLLINQIKSLSSGK